VQKGKNKIIEYKTFLIPPNQTSLKSGSYSFPFVIETPNNIPGTFQASMRRFEAKISYKAKLILKERREILGKNKTEITIEQVLDQNRYSILTPHSGKIACCDCFSKGICNLTVHIDKNAYLPNETAKLWVEVDNSKTRRDLKNLVVMLWRVIRLISGDQEVGVFKKSIFVKNIETKVPSGMKLLTGQEVCIDVPIASKEVKLDQCATTLGKIVQCRYYIEVSTDFGRCMSREVDFEVPLIVIPKFIEPVMPSAPEDWDPVEMPLMRVSVDSSRISIIDRSELGN
jgi:hypothetical protein